MDATVSEMDTPSKDSVSPDVSYTLNCPHCNKNYRHYRSLKYHVAKAHPDQLQDLQPSKEIPCFASSPQLNSNTDFQIIKNIQGKDQLLYESYLYRNDKVFNGATYFRCVAKSCKCRAKVKGNELSKSGVHNHPPPPSPVTKRDFVEQLRTRVINEPGTSVKNIYESEIAKTVACLEASKDIPSYKSVKTNLYKIRNAVWPACAKKIARDRKVQRGKDQRKWKSTRKGKKILLVNEGVGDSRFLPSFSMTSQPGFFKRLMVQKLTSNFRDAVSIETTEMCHPKKGEICVKTKFVGINASDINMTKGRYFVSEQFPYPVGLETVGHVVEVGEDVSYLRVGQSVAFLNGRCSSYAEYVCVPAIEVFAIPEATAQYLALLVSGLTATIGLDKVGHITAGETVLITAAAGGAGHIAVQWAKSAGCHVIGTCSALEKEIMLKLLGCDRVINYKTECLDEVLKREYPRGVDVVWESIGGKVFEDCLKNIAVRGRLVVVGGISGYKSENKEALLRVNYSTWPEQLLFKSAAVQGFLLLVYKDCFPNYFKYMMENVQNGTLTTVVDDGAKSTGAEFVGMDGIIRGVEHLHSGKNIGKVVVRLS